MLFFLFITNKKNAASQVADTQKHADRAAKLAVVEYDIQNLEEPILNVDDAVKRSSFFEVHPMFYPEPVGDVLKGMEEAERKILSVEVLQLSFKIFTSKFLLSHS